MNHSTPKADQTGDEKGFGAKLTEARKKRHMSVDDVASELNILKRHVEAIESEDFEALPHFAFVRGFISNYARLVDLPHDSLISQFDNAYPKHLKQDSVDSIKSPIQPMGTLHRGRTPIRINIGLILGIIALVVLAAAILKMISGTKSNIPTQATDEVQIVDSLSTAEQAQGAAIGNVGSAIDTQNTTTTTTSGEGRLDIWVKASTTLSVKDSTGKVLISGEQKRGGHELKGTPPFSVEIGQADKVDLNFNNNPVNLKAHGSNPATLTLQ